VKRYILLLSLLPILFLPNAGCSRFIELTERRAQQPQSSRELLELKLKCAEVGHLYDSDFERELRASGQFHLRARFAYNAKLNTCIYRGGSLTKAGSSYFILDLATNEDLANYTTIGSDDSANLSNQVMFERREKELFGPDPYLFDNPKKTGSR